LGGPRRPDDCLALIDPGALVPDLDEASPGDDHEERGVRVVVRGDDRVPLQRQLGDQATRILMDDRAGHPTGPRRAVWSSVSGSEPADIHRWALAALARARVPSRAVAAESVASSSAALLLALAPAAAPRTLARTL